MIHTPWLSVLLPTYNGEKYLADTLNSVVMQNDPDIEILAVDDGSSDATLDILSSFRGKLPMRITHSSRSGNWVANTNLALSKAKGSYVCLLHQDDLWLAERLKILKSLVRQFPENSLLLHPSFFIDAKGKRLGIWRCPLPAYPRMMDAGKMTAHLLVQNFIPIPAPVFKRAAALRVGGLDDRLWYTPDWDFWLKLAATGKTIYYPVPLTAFRLHAESQTILRSGSVTDFRKQLETVFQKHFNAWQVPVRIKNKTRKVARFSIEVNIALAGMVHGKTPDIKKILSCFLDLGPREWHRYFRDSRILERLLARLKTRMRPAL